MLQKGKKKGQARRKQWGISKLRNLTMAILISKKPVGVLRQENDSDSKMAE